MLSCCNGVNLEHLWLILQKKLPANFTAIEFQLPISYTLINLIEENRSLVMWKKTDNPNFSLWVHHKRDNMIWEMSPFHGFRKIYNVPHQQPTVCPARLSHQLWSACILSSNGYTMHVFSKFFILKSVPSSPAEASLQWLSSKTPYVFQTYGVSYSNTPSQKPVIDHIAGKQLKLSNTINRKVVMNLQVYQTFIS